MKEGAPLCWRPSRSQIHRTQKRRRVFLAGIKACASLGQPPGLETDGVTLMADHVLSDPAITLKAKNTLNILAKADGITQKANPTKADDITLKAKANDIRHNLEGKNTLNILAKADDLPDITLKAAHILNDPVRADGITLKAKHILDDPAKADGVTLKAKNTLDILAKTDDITLKAKANDITLKAKNMNDSARVDGITLKSKHILDNPAKADDVRPSGDGADVEDGLLDVQDLARLNQASWRTYRIAAVLIAANAKRFL